MQNYNLDILGISECRWLGPGKVTTNSGQTILYSGHKDKHQSGVVIIISDRLIRARFSSKYCKLTIFQCYAPTSEADDEVKDDFYEQL